MRFNRCWNSLQWVFSLFNSAGVEILEEIPNPDIVIVCCGGGGLVSGIAASIKLKGSKATRIFAVEPEGGGWIKGHVR